jgi:hypothetical protein
MYQPHPEDIKRLLVLSCVATKFLLLYYNKVNRSDITVGQAFPDPPAMYKCTLTREYHCCKLVCMQLSKNTFNYFFKIRFMSLF